VYGLGEFLIVEALLLVEYRGFGRRSATWLFLPNKPHGLVSSWQLRQHLV